MGYLLRFFTNNKTFQSLDITLLSFSFQDRQLRGGISSTADPLRMATIDIRDYPELVEYINRRITAGDIVELKRESGQTLTAIRIDRKLGIKIKADKTAP